MSGIASITINDGKATPVAHTYNPIKSEPATYREAVAGVAQVGQGRLAVASKLTSQPAGMNRVNVKLELPVLETAAANGSYSGYIAGPGVAYTTTVNVDFILPNRGTEAERKDLRVLLINALQNAQITDAVDKLQAPY